MKILKKLMKSCIICVLMYLIAEILFKIIDDISESKKDTDTYANMCPYFIEKE